MNMKESFNAKGYDYRHKQRIWIRVTQGISKKWVGSISLGT